MNNTDDVRLRSRANRDALMMDIAWWYRNRYRVVGLVAITAMITMMFGYHVLQNWKQADLIKDLETQREERRVAFNEKKKRIQEGNKMELAALEEKLKTHLDEQRKKFRIKLNDVEIAKKSAEAGVKQVQNTISQKNSELKKVEDHNKKRSKDMTELLKMAREDIDEIKKDLARCRVEEAKLEDERARRLGRQSVTNAKNQDDAIVQHAVDEFNSDQRKLRNMLDQINIGDQKGTDTLNLRNTAAGLYNRMKGLHKALGGILQSEPELGRRFANQINPAIRAGTLLAQEYEAMTQKPRAGRAAYTGQGYAPPVQNQ